MREPDAKCKSTLGCALCLALVFTSSISRAEDVPVRRELRFTLDKPWVDFAVTGAALSLWVSSEALRGALSPSNCRWCNPPGVDTSSSDALRWSNTRTANKISNVLAYGLVPAGAMGVYALHAATARYPATVSPWEDFTLDMVIIAEATALAADVNQVAKIWIARRRPSVHAAVPANEEAASRSSDDNRSFYSAHTNTSMAIAVSACTVASMRGYGWAPVLCMTLPTMALGAGYLRVASDNHYFTDVAVGAIAGAAFGFAVPYFLHQPRSADSTKGAKRTSVTPYMTKTDGGLRLGLVGEF